MATIDLLSTGVPGLDAVLGGGLPELSFNLVVGDPGTGKTTLVNQMIFSHATPEEPALYVTLAGEPPIKMLRYQQQFPFFDRERVGRAVHFVNLEDEVSAGDLDAVLERIEEEVARVEPSLVAVDSLTSLHGVVFGEGPDEGGRNMRIFVRRLGMYLTRWEATTFLIGEFKDQSLPHSPIFTVADGIIRVSQTQHEDSIVRKLRVLKLRGRRELPGLHPFRITDEGVRVHPRIGTPVEDAEVERSRSKARVSFGVEGLDEMTEGGAVSGDSIMISGPSGSGKSVLAMHFAKAGIEAGESVVIAVFEEHPSNYRLRLEEIGADVEKAVGDGRLELLYQPLSDLSVAEAFAEIAECVERLGASRVVVDSLTGLEVSVSDPSEKRVREAIYRNVRALTRRGVTVALVSEVGQTTDALRLTPHEVSVLADDVILQRYVEIRGELENILTVVKMRRSAHSKIFHRYEIKADGLHVGRPIKDFHGVLTGVPQLTGEPEATFPGGGGQAGKETGDEASHETGRSDAT